MEILKFALILAGAIVVAGIMFMYARSRKAAKESAYVPRRPLKSYEQTLYWRLVKALPDHAVLAQICMNRCVAVKGRNAATLARENLDFVICNKALRILAVIEIEDESRPLTDHRRNIEWLKEEALDAAGIRLIKCSPTSLPSEAYIAMEFGNDSISRLAA
jgi:hypothetical protein